MERKTTVKKHIRAGRVVRQHQRRIPGSRGSQTATGLGAVIVIAALGLGANGGQDPPVLEGLTTPAPFAQVRTVPTSLRSQSPVAAPPQLSSPTSAAARWDGAWVRNYRVPSGACTGMVSLWVVQPGTKAGFYQLVSGCFTQEWERALVDKCRSYRSALPAGTCAVWDPAAIVGSAGARGDLLVVALTDACLARAGQDAYHVGAVHTDCVTRPRQ